MAQLARTALAVMVGVIGVITLVYLWEPHRLGAVVLALIIFFGIVESEKKDPGAFGIIAIVIVLVTAYFTLLK